MKCALPGRYGKKNPIESSAILDSYYDTDIDGEKILSEDIGLNFEEAINRFEEMRDEFIKSIEEDSHISDLKKNKLNELKLIQQELLQKDKEECSQKLQGL